MAAKTNAKKPFGERLHAGNPAVEAARHHFRTRALRCVPQHWMQRRGWVKWDAARQAWVKPPAVVGEQPEVVG